MATAPTKITRGQLLELCLEIAEVYAGNLTARQLYYQLVARGHIPNGQKSYRRVIETLTNARLAGTFPLDWIMDRTREARPGRYTTDMTDLEEAYNFGVNAVTDGFPVWYLKRDRWFRQPNFVSVWVEKEALAGVFEGPCDSLGVSWFVCRGYASIPSLNQWCDRYIAAVDAGEGTGQDGAVVLYFGDHDPDGLEIPRSARRNLHQILKVRGREDLIDHGDNPVRFVNCALTIDQIHEYDPPPFPAKPTSSRYKRYVEDTGLYDAWELDALPPNVLDTLIRDSIRPWFDRDIYRENNDMVDDLRDQFREGFLKHLTNGFYSRDL